MIFGVVCFAFLLQTKLFNRPTLGHSQLAIMEFWEQDGTTLGLTGRGRPLEDSCAPSAGDLP